MGRTTQKRAFFRKATIALSVLLCVACVAATGVLVLDACKVIDIKSEANRIYTVTFYQENEVLSRYTLYRGDKLDQIEFPNPQKAGSINKRYVFAGWDLTGDNIPDVFPSRIFSNINANAVFIPIYEIL